MRWSASRPLHMTQTNGKTESHNKTPTVRLHHYVAEYKRDWNIFKQLLTYVYNTQLNRSTETTSFILVLSRHLPGQTTFGRSYALLTDAKHARARLALRYILLYRVATLQEKTDKKITTAQHRYKDHHDCRVCADTRLGPGQRVYVDHSPLT